MFITELMKIPLLAVRLGDKVKLVAKEGKYYINNNQFEFLITQEIYQLLNFISQHKNPSLSSVRAEIGNYNNASSLIIVIGNLIIWKHLILSVMIDGKPIISIDNTVTSGKLIGVVTDDLDDKKLLLSRFANIAREGEQLFLSQPLKDKRFLINDNKLSSLFFNLFTGVSFEEICQQYNPKWQAGIALIIRILLAEKILLTIGDTIPSRLEEGSAVDTQWDVNDLNFHSKSRFGYHFGDFGGAFPFVNLIEPRPAVRPLPDGDRIDLYKPDIDKISKSDPSLTEVQMRRMSVRQYDEDNPINLTQIGEFLYRTGRVLFSSTMQVTNVIDASQTTDMQLAWRPYPTGGASYELEIYLTVDRSADLESGMYYYAPKTHQLVRISGHNQHTKSLIETAYSSCARIVKPQVLVHIAARFQRVSWKYHAIAYATMLRNTGVLYQTFYMNAIAMGIAPCGLGSGDIKTFGLATKNDPLVESNIGEFMLGSLPKDFNLANNTQEKIASFHGAVVADNQS